MKVAIIGYSGHAYVVLEVIQSMGMQPAVYCEPREKAFNPYALQYLGDEQDTEVLRHLKQYPTFLGIGSNRMRKQVYHHLQQQGIVLPPAIHARSVVSATAQVGDATLIMPGAVVNALATLGKGVICNTASVVEHECRVGDFSHIAPGAVLAGNVGVGAGAFIGANAVIKQGVHIGDGAIVGAGAVVIRDVPAFEKVAGNPSKKIS